MTFSSPFGISEQKDAIVSPADLSVDEKWSCVPGCEMSLVGITSFLMHLRVDHRIPLDTERLAPYVVSAIMFPLNAE